MTQKGYADRLKENLQVLDEAIQNARCQSKKKDPSALQWSKNLRDLVELRNTTLTNIKIHLLGRDETGSSVEPPDYYTEVGEGPPSEEFEAAFKKFFKVKLGRARQETESKRCETW